MQVVGGRFGAVVLDEGEAARAQDVVVAALHAPVEAGPSELVVVHGAVADAERGPRGEAALPEVTAQHLRGQGTIATRERAREQEHSQDRAVEDS